MNKLKHIMLPLLTVTFLLVTICIMLNFELSSVNAQQLANAQQVAKPIKKNRYAQLMEVDDRLRRTKPTDSPTALNGVMLKAFETCWKKQQSLKDSHGIKYDLDDYKVTFMADETRYYIYFLLNIKPVNGIVTLDEPISRYYLVDKKTIKIREIISWGYEWSDSKQ